MIVQGNALNIPLEDCTVQCCVTSPPYFGLRDYNISGQLGLEDTPEEYIANLVNVFREVRRVLKDDGIAWLNIGDSYAGSNNGSNDYREAGASLSKNDNKYGMHKPGGGGLKPKDLMMIPARVVLALQADGWWLRSEIVWHKPNPMPESVRDRPTKSHEMIYLLAKSARYYYDAEAIKEPANYPGDDRKACAKVEHKSMPDGIKNGLRPGNYTYDLATRNKRDVWEITTKPYKGAHFATYPPDLIEPCILAGTSEKGECPECGKAWKRVVKNEYTPTRPGINSKYFDKNGKDNIRGDASGHLKHRTELATTTLGWRPQCDCGLDPVPQIVLDPFNGSGTTGEVAIKHGRKYVGVELNMEYIELSKKRIADTQIVFAVP